MTPVLLLLVALLQAQAANAELGYRFTLPAGFVPYPEARATNADLVDCWTEEAPASPRGALVLCVQRMHGVLPREAMKPGDVPASARLVAFPWRGFTLQGLRTVTEQNGDSVFVLVAQVPLRREAIQITIGGLAIEEERGASEMHAILATLEGESNWLTSEERSARLGRIVGIWGGVAVALVALYVWRRKRAAA